MMYIKYMEKHFWKEYLCALQFVCVSSSHDLYVV